MDTQVRKETSYGISPQSIMLANQARLEQVRYGHISVRCPKCNSTPEIITTPHGERTTIRCKCGYIMNEEINL